MNTSYKYIKACYTKDKPRTFFRSSSRSTSTRKHKLVLKIDESILKNWSQKVDLIRNDRITQINFNDGSNDNIQSLASTLRYLSLTNQINLDFIPELIPFIEKVKEKVESVKKQSEDDEYLTVDNKLAEDTKVLLNNFAKSIYEKYGYLLIEPSIEVNPYAGLNLYWSTSSAKLLLVIKSNSNTAYFYGEDSQKIPYKGGIKTDTLTSHFIVWLKENLSLPLQEYQLGK